MRWQKHRSMLSMALILLLSPSCDPEPTDVHGVWMRATSRVVTPSLHTVGVDGRDVQHQMPYLKDSDGRYVHIRGINVSGSTKFPVTEEFPSRYPLPTDPTLKQRCQTIFPMPSNCIPEQTVNYVGRPFDLEEADRWYGQLAALGFNSVRLIMNWEAIEPQQRGVYDAAYLDYYEQLVAIARRHGLYVLVDMHQDIFSRHLFAYYNESPDAEAGGIDAMILSLFPPYTDWVRGHGAPRWVVQTILAEKNMNARHWGMFRGLGALRTPGGGINQPAIDAIQRLLARFSEGGEAPDIGPWVSRILSLDHFDVDETCDVLPWTQWGLNGVLSIDINRCFAAFFAGDTVFPQRSVDGQNLKDYLQEAYIGAYLQVVQRVAKYDNVIGYDLMNEPVGAFIALTAAAAYVQSGLPEAVDAVLSVLGEDIAGDVSALLFGLNLLPEIPIDATPEEKEAILRKWGLDGVNLGALLDLNASFDAHYLQPFYERLGQAIQEIDPNAIIWYEPGMTLRTFTGPSPVWDTPLTRLQGVRQAVFAPHWYPDIYPALGFNSPSRQFNADEYLYRDFRDALHKYVDAAPAWLGNVPTVFGEFGTYFNFGGIQKSIDEDYLVSAHVLNAYYEAFEDLNLGNMVWCFSKDNTHEKGEGWDKEDFSLIDPEGRPRAWSAWVRPHARATSGRLIGQKFYSQFSYFEPIKGQHPPERLYTLRMQGKETDAPTMVYVPSRQDTYGCEDNVNGCAQYPDGFYVWLSDGYAYYDGKHQMLYWYPTNDDPKAEHSLQIRPKLPDQDVAHWSYFFTPEHTVNGKGGLQ
ncbi:MAG: cellulase family glycosylhydrolase [Myxococcota bacterium]|jgi:hypothetical protein|nr:cellulase family glycosylhydrolase [Myxococcota bacterium]